MIPNLRTYDTVFRSSSFASTTNAFQALEVLIIQSLAIKNSLHAFFNP
jgi:hypothetical protein